MPVFSHPEFDGHEEVVFFAEPTVGLQAIVAVHNTVRGPALGGCRMYPYASEAEALTDVLRLSRGMSYKSAISRLPLGGGKSVIIGDPRRDKSEALLQAFGRCLDKLGGRYIVAEDSGTTVADMDVIAGQSGHVSGLGRRPMPDGATADGDPSPATAFGVFRGIQAALMAEDGRESLGGVRVAVQGAGAVGRRLAAHLAGAGARVYVADVMAGRAEACLRDDGRVEVVSPEAVLALDADVLAPCGFGAVLNDRTIPRLRCRIVAGAANNQLAEPRHAEMLAGRGILYVPDFAVNAGGVIDIAGFQAGLSYEASMAQVGRIYDTVTEIIDSARERGLTPNAVALAMAEANFRKTGS